MDFQILNRNKGKVYSTLNIPTKDRFDFWVDAICRNIIRTDCAPHRDRSDFFGEICCTSIGEISFIEMRATPLIFTRNTRNFQQLNEDNIILVLQLSPDYIRQLDSCQLSSSKNEILLLDGEKGRRLQSNSNINSLIVNIPKSLFQTHNIAIDKYHGHILRENSTLSALASHFIQTAAKNSFNTTLLEQQIIVSKIIDLLVCAVAAEKQYDHKSLVYESQLVTIKEFIATHAASQPLNAEDVARQNGISTRYLHKLFEKEEYTVSQFINNCRVNIAKKLLTSPHCKLNLTGVALASGFSCSASFSRKFREMCNISPREFRNEHALTG